MIQFNNYRISEIPLEKLREYIIYTASMRVSRRKSDNKIVVSDLDFVYKEFSKNKRFIIEPTFIGDSFNIVYFSEVENAVTFYNNHENVSKSKIRDYSKYEPIKTGLFRYAFSG